MEKNKSNMETNDLVFEGSNGNIVTNSIIVAETFGKLHKNIIRDIKTLIGGMPNFEHTPLFEETKYANPQNGQQYPMYIMNRDGFTLLAMGFTGKKAMAFKLKYIEAFNRMEKELKQGNQYAASDVSLKEFAKRVYESECEKERMSEELSRLKRENAMLQESCVLSFQDWKSWKNNWLLTDRGRKSRRKKRGKRFFLPSTGLK